MVDLEAIGAVADVLRAQARRRGAAPAILFEGASTTYAELDRRSDHVARALVRARVALQDRVAILARNCSQFYEIAFGTAKARACLAPINFRLAAPEVAYILQDAGTAILFVASEFFSVAEQAIHGLQRRPTLIALDRARGEYLRYDDWRDAAAETECASQSVADDDVLQLYTSGTTGQPKGVRLTNRNYRFFLQMRAQVAGFDYRADETVLIVMPLYHVAGVNISLAGFAGGSRVIVEKAFEPAAALRLIERERVSHVFLAPSMIQMLLQQPEIGATDLSSLRTIAYGASPIAENVLARAKAAFGCSFVQFYGMTESTGAGTYLAPSDHQGTAKLRSCGKPWPGVEVRVVDGHGRPLPAHQVGEIAMRGGHIMKGYWRQEDATAKAIPDGWLRTGDAGHFDEDGYLYVYDRVKDMIVTGAENVYPAEVENAIAGCPGVIDVAVVGVPSQRWGEEVKAVVVADVDHPPSADSIVAWTKARIAAYKAPKSVDFVSELPRNAAGKVLRRELRLRYWRNRDRVIG